VCCPLLLLDIVSLAKFIELLKNYRLGILGLLRDKYSYFVMCFTDGGQDNGNEDAPENNPSYTTVYVGNLPHDVSYMN
jgi:hypothetical protein